MNLVNNRGLVDVRGIGFPGSLALGPPGSLIISVGVKSDQCKTGLILTLLKDTGADQAKSSNYWPAVFSLPFLRVHGHDRRADGPDRKALEHV